MGIVDRLEYVDPLECTVIDSIDILQHYTGEDNYVLIREDDFIEIAIRIKLQ